MDHVNTALAPSGRSSGTMRYGQHVHGDLLVQWRSRGPGCVQKAIRATCRHRASARLHRQGHQRRLDQRLCAVSTQGQETGNGQMNCIEVPDGPGTKLFDPSYYDGKGRLLLKNLSWEELVEWCGSLDEEKPEKRARQLWRWMYADKAWLQDIDDAPASQVQNGFSDSFRDKVRNISTFHGGLEIQDLFQASDGTRKLVFRSTVGPTAGGLVETVIIPITRERGAKDRVTLCVSSQVGCAMGCRFCYTGKMGLMGNLLPGQIVDQVVIARRLMYEEFLGSNNLQDSNRTEGDDINKTRNRSIASYATPITNIVYMGMGEPLDNLEHVITSISTVTDHHGLHFSRNKVTVSTVGLVPEMKELVNRCDVALAVSLHGSTDSVRSSIVPVNNRYPLSELVGALKEMFPEEVRSAPHVLIEYTMIRGVNDRVEDAHALLKLLEGVKCKINLIVFNPHEGTVYEASSDESVEDFRNIMIHGGRVVTVRASRGDDSMAACGQLGDAKRVRAIRNKQTV